MIKDRPCDMDIVILEFINAVYRILCNNDIDGRTLGRVRSISHKVLSGKTDVVIADTSIPNHLKLLKFAGIKVNGTLTTEEYIITEAFLSKTDVCSFEWEPVVSDCGRLYMSLFDIHQKSIGDNDDSPVLFKDFPYMVSTYMSIYNLSCVLLDIFQIVNPIIVRPSIFENQYDIDDITLLSYSRDALMYVKYWSNRMHKIIGMVPCRQNGEVYNVSIIPEYNICVTKLSDNPTSQHEPLNVSRYGLHLLPGQVKQITSIAKDTNLEDEYIDDEDI